jgi:glycosyltransferase involved in cell wall biosynthesis
MSQTPLNLLCVEPSFPGRLGQAADWLVRKRGYRCHFACHALGPQAHWPSSMGRGLDVISYNVGGVAREPVVAWQRHFERSLCYAYGAWEVIDARRIRPVDVVLGRSGGLGSSLFLPVSYPRIPLVQRFDYFLPPDRHDLADEDAPLMSPEYVYWRRSANAMDLVDLENGGRPWAPSVWQRDLYPPEYHDDFVVIPEGVDYRAYSSPSRGNVRIGDRTLDTDVKVVTFVANVPDRLRGFDRFVELAARLITERDDTVCIAVGGGMVDRMLDVRHFGSDYAASVVTDSPIAEHERFWRVGRLDPPMLQALLARSDLHVYPGRTYPLARSLFQAMCAGACVLANDTPPVREVLTHECDALLSNAADHEAFFNTARRALADDELRNHLGRCAARLIQQHYDLDIVMPQLAALLEQRVLGH